MWIISYVDTNQGERIKAFRSKGKAVEYLDKITEYGLYENIRMGWRSKGEKEITY